MSNPDAIFVLVPYDGQGTTTEVLQIMNRVVFQGSKYIYITENMSLLLWIYDNNGIKEILLK